MSSSRGRALRQAVAGFEMAGRGLGRLAGVYLRNGRPFILNHIITVRCNLQCPFCYISGPEQLEFNRQRFPRRLEMTTGEIGRFYGELAGLGFRLAVLVGGEPLLRSDLDDILSFLRGRIFATVFTNGLVLEERAELLRKAASVFVSLDAPDEEHDVLRDKPGLFKKTLAGVEAVRRRYPRVKIAIMTTVTDANVGRVEGMLALARSLDLPIAFQPPSYDGQFGLEGRPEAESAGSLPEVRPLSEAFRTILDAAGRQRVIASRAFYRHVIADRPTYPCHYPAYVLGPVYPDGSVLGCTTSDFIGNVREEGAAGVLSGLAWRANAAAGPLCPKGCRDWGLYDISALHNHRMRAEDLYRLTRAFVA